jgi:hypothetical protein
MQAENPALSTLVRAFAVVVVVVLSAGILLLVSPDTVSPRWPWKLTPFNARFLGAFYSAELIAMGWLFWRNRWSPGRLVLIMALCFTLIVSLACLGHLERFNFGRKGPWIWFLLYVGSALLSAYFLWRYWLLPHPGRTLSEPWRLFFITQGIVVGGYGVALLISPETAGAFWPWPLDRFHGQVYSGIFLAAALGSFVLAWRAAPEELLVFRATLIALGLAAVASLILADAAVHKVDWSTSGTWIWIGAFLAIAVAGALSVAWGARAQQARSV